MTESLEYAAPARSAPQSLTMRDAQGEMPALVWHPDAETAPVLVMLPDYFGTDEPLQHAAARLCDAGYLVLVPDLLHNSGVPAPDALAEIEDWALKQSDAANVTKVLRAVEFARALEGADSTRAGILGWGWSGALALIAASHDAPVRVVCDIGGAINYPVTTANRPGSPMNFIADLEAVIFAAFPGADPAFPDEEVRRLHARIVEHDKVGEVKVYDLAPPRFWRDDSLPQTRAFWRRLLNFLAENLAMTQEGTEPLGGYPNEEARLMA